MKKLLFSANTLDLGGIEKALVTWINYLASTGKYELTLVLEKKQGIFLEKLDKKVKVIEYVPSHNKIALQRKIINMCKRLNFIFKYKNKFDFSASFATYSQMGSFVARTASRNCALWGHADYLELYNGNKEEMKKFFKMLQYDKFKKYVFVSEEGKQSFEKCFQNQSGKVYVCNNMINSKEIIELSNEAIEEKKKQDITFLNVGRHDETQKCLTRLIEASKKLKQEGYKFRVLMIGDGPDSKKYKELVLRDKLGDTIVFMGRKQNPYPYFKISDVVVLTSDYEGYPVVFLESMALGKTIITTNVSGSSSVETGKYGIVTEKNTDSIYAAMKYYIENGYEPSKFDVDMFNKDMKEKMEKIIEE